MIRRKPDGDFEIVVNAKHHMNRQRFTVAHEIGHFIFHRARLANGTSDTLAYRIDGHVFPNPNIGPEQERQANNFAANLLIPSQKLRGALAAEIEDERQLAEVFQVSLAAMRIKLGVSRQTNMFGHDSGDALPERDRYGFDAG
jgi:Zn-dependent peptidase ImmA (M78 family)